MDEEVDANDDVESREDRLLFERDEWRTEDGAVTFNEESRGATTGRLLDDDREGIAGGADERACSCECGIWGAAIRRISRCRCNRTVNTSGIGAGPFPLFHCDESRKTGSSDRRVGASRLLNVHTFHRKGS